MHVCLQCNNSSKNRVGKYFCSKKCYMEYYGIKKRKKYIPVPDLFTSSQNTALPKINTVKDILKELPNKKLLNHIKCRKCNNSFIPQNKSNVICKICSQYKPVTKKDIEKTCKECHKKFITNNYHKIYCSKDCAEKKAKKYFKLSNFQIFERDNFRCVYCGKTSYEDNVKLIVEHIYPRSKGGTNELFNTVTACAKCNTEKFNRILNTDLILSIWKVTNERNKEFQINYDEIKSIFDSKYKINK